MPIAAHFKETEQDIGQQRAARRTLFLRAQGVLPDGAGTAVQVHNISATGLLLESELALAPGETIAVDLPQTGMRPATVIWHSGALFGCQFDAPLSSAILSAAELRSAISRGAELASAGQDSERSALGGNSGESFALRLQRLRKGQRLTQAQVAAAVGVSKPTVWAWEQGRARPVEARLDALAQVLDVDRAALLAQPDARAAGELVARCREQIAAAFGTDIGNVRIMIEL